MLVMGEEEAREVDGAGYKLTPNRLPNIIIIKTIRA